MSRILSTGMTVVSLYRLYTVRSQRELGVTSRLDDARSQEFPAVTICNVNAVVASGLAASNAQQAPTLAKFLQQLMADVSFVLKLCLRKDLFHFYVLECMGNIYLLIDYLKTT